MQISQTRNKRLVKLNDKKDANEKLDIKFSLSARKRGNGKEIWDQVSKIC